MRSDPRRLRGLTIWLGYVLILPFFRKFTVVNETAIFRQLEEALLVLLLAPAIRGFKIFLGMRPWGRLFVSFFACYLVLGLLSWIYSDIPIGAAVLQFLLELKLPYVIFAFVGLGQPYAVFRRIMPLMKGLLLLSLPLTLFQFLAPATYMSVFPATATQGVFHTLGGATLPRGTGAFWFSGGMAYFAAIATGIFFVRAVLARKRGELWWFAIALVALLSTLQRQEIAGTVVLLPLMLLVVHRQRVVGEKILLGSILTLGLALIILPFAPIAVDYLAVTARRLGLGEASTMSSVARVLFYVRGFELANQHFPLGAGLGGFAGHAAAVFDSPVYERLGFRSLTWFQEGRWMTDTFWPHVYGEAGWLGLLAYLGALGSLLLLLWHEYRHSHRASKRAYSAIALFSFLFLLNVSITAPVMTTMMPLGLSFMFFGVLDRRLVRRRRRPTPHGPLEHDSQEATSSARTESRALGNPDP